MHMDYKPLTFLTSLKIQKELYGYWANQLQRLNIKIIYISGPRNKATDKLFQIIFWREDCHIISNLFLVILANIKIYEIWWIWKEKLDGYNIFLDSLSKDE